MVTIKPLFFFTHFIPKPAIFIRCISKSSHKPWECLLSRLYGVCRRLHVGVCRRVGCSPFRNVVRFVKYTVVVVVGVVPAECAVELGLVRLEQVVEQHPRQHGGEMRLLGVVGQHHATRYQLQREQIHQTRPHPPCFPLLSQSLTRTHTCMRLLARRGRLVVGGELVRRCGCSAMHCSIPRSMAVTVATHSSLAEGLPGNMAFMCCMASFSATSELSRH